MDLVEAANSMVKDVAAGRLRYTATEVSERNHYHPLDETVMAEILSDYLNRLQPEGGPYYEWTGSGQECRIRLME